MQQKIFLLLLFVNFLGFSQSNTAVFELNKKLGRGINMGNMFEAPTETEWGNQFRDDYFQRIANLGFNHVRIPIRWDTPARTSQTAPYSIDKQFLERIKYAVDKALAEKLYVVINMHHHEEIFTNPDQEKAKFVSQWNQIATYFKDYDNRLLFEILNEPHDKLNDKWNIFLADALTEIRKTNKTRAVLIGTNNWGGLAGLATLSIPKDNNLILTVHYYDPFQFTHQGAEWVAAEAQKWLGTKWENTNLERNEIINQFQYLVNFSKQNNIPVHIGEFGSYSKADIESRVKWTNFLARWFEEKGFSWAYWEFSAGFGIFDPKTNQYLMPLVDALLKNPMSEANIVNTKTILESKFDTNTNDWVLYLQTQAKASFSKNNNTGVIDVSQASTDGWHVQLVRNEVSLKKDKRYLVSFDAAANVATPITNYLGKAVSPYNAYSDYKGFTLSKDFQNFTYSFVMTADDDAKARIVFDLGTKIAQISIKNFILQEVITNETVVLANENQEPTVILFPNPTADILTLTGVLKFDKLVLLDLSGRELIYKTLNRENEVSVSVSDIPFGEYVVLLLGNDKKISRKVIKL